MPLNQKGFAPLFLILILLAGIGIAVYLTQFTQIFKPKAVEESISTIPSGWDYNLTKQCVRSILEPGTQNYYQDLTDCAQPVTKSWTIAVQSESSANQSCLGPNGQSLPIGNNGLSLNWLPHTDEQGRNNKTAHLSIDYLNHTHPCGAGNFTWLALQDNVSHGGGPIPRPDQARSSMRLSFSDNRISGEDRLIIGYQSFYIIQNTPRAITIEVSFVSPGWGSPEDPSHNIIKKSINNGNYEISMDGNNMPGKFGIQANPRNGETMITVNWYELIQYLITNNIIPNVDGGTFTDANSAGAITFVALEAENKAAANSILSEIWVTNYRTERVSQQTPAQSLSPSPPSSSSPAHPSPSPSPSVSPSPSPSGTAGKGDGDNDGKVDLRDLSILFSKWSPAKDITSHFKLDFNDDLRINTIDFFEMNKLLLSLEIIRR